VILRQKGIERSPTTAKMTDFQGMKRMECGISFPRIMPCICTNSRTPKLKFWKVEVSRPQFHILNCDVISGPCILAELLPWVGYDIVWNDVADCSHRFDHVACIRDISIPGLVNQYPEAKGKLEARQSQLRSNSTV
jgi:hypothetical protein